jgi:hypothetical protein
MYRIIHLTTFLIYCQLCCGVPITSKVMLHCTICFLAGRSYRNIRHIACTSKASFYHLIWHTIHAISHCAALKIKLPSDDEIISIGEGFEQKQKSTRDNAINCFVGALDGCLVRLKALSPEECGGNVSVYYSGHYCCYGKMYKQFSIVIVFFSYFAVAAPRKTNDTKAIKNTKLLDWIEKFSPGYLVACDWAHSISKH